MVSYVTRSLFLSSEAIHFPFKYYKQRGCFFYKAFVWLSVKTFWEKMINLLKEENKKNTEILISKSEVLLLE